MEMKLRPLRYFKAVVLYAQWVVNDHLVLSPLVGFYTPDSAAADGGTQIGDDDTNIYSQVIAIVNF